MSAIFGGVGNENGAVEVQDASGATIGRWDKDGIAISSGTMNIGQFSVDKAGVHIGNLLISAEKGDYILYAQNGKFELSVDSSGAYLRLGEDTKKDRTVLTEETVDANQMHVWNADEWQISPYSGDIGKILDAIWTGHDWSLESLMDRLDDIEEQISNMKE